MCLGTDRDITVHSYLINTETDGNEHKGGWKWFYAPPIFTTAFLKILKKKILWSEQIIFFFLFFFFFILLLH